MEGWIKLHRQILSNPICKKPNYAWLWISLLLKANHQDKHFIWNNKKQVCKKGQILTGRNELAKETGISASTIENILNYLEDEQQIEQQKTTKYRLVTILNWEKYQATEQQIKQQSDSRVTTERQQSDTNKNDKNVKNDKKSIPAEFEKFWQEYPKRNGRKATKKESIDFVQKNIRNIDMLELIMATQNYAKSDEAQKGFARDPIRFLKKDFWRDFIEFKGKLSKEDEFKKLEERLRKEGKIDENGNYIGNDADIFGSKH